MAVKGENEEIEETVPAEFGNLQMPQVFQFLEGREGGGWE